MKYFVVCLSLFAAGCFGQTYESVRVGPDRFTVSSFGNDQGPDNYGHILEQAYTTCYKAGFKDYAVVQTVLDTRQVIVFVRCQSEGQGFAQATPDTNAPQDPNHPTSFTDDIDKLYQSAKKKIKEVTQQ